MSANSSIEWTDRTWNPVRGCSVVSPGCHRCYAMKQAHRFSGLGRAYEGLTKLTSAGPQWTGVIRTVDAELLEPLSWRKPQRVFVNSMSDLFHDDVPDAFIDRVFAVMAARSIHTFQILTKRADRMRAYMSDPLRHLTVIEAWSRTLPRRANRTTIANWPLPNVWLGVSVEDQKHADERIPQLLQTPAAVRFISAEPLLGRVDLADLSVDAYTKFDALTGHKEWPSVVSWSDNSDSGPRLDWVIVGGESGAGARPFDVEWARSVVQQCRAADVPVFVKQLGSFPVVDNEENCATLAPHVGKGTNKRAPSTWREPWPWVPTLRDRKGGDMAEWPEDLRVRQFPEVRA